jgi:signal peptidase II
MLIVILSFAVAVFDQLTKHLVRCRFELGEIHPVIPGVFDLRYIRNTGAAWGMMAGFSHWLVALSVAMLLAIVIFRRTFLSDTLIHRIAAGLMIAGIVGNLIDRVRLGYVVDFLDFYWQTHHFPAFNVADSAICTGVGLYMLSQFLAARAAPASPREAPAP